MVEDVRPMVFYPWLVVFPALRRNFGAGYTRLDFLFFLARPRSCDRTSDGGCFSKGLAHFQATIPAFADL